MFPSPCAHIRLCPQAKLPCGRGASEHRVQLVCLLFVSMGKQIGTVLAQPGTYYVNYWNLLWDRFLEAQWLSAASFPLPGPTARPPVPWLCRRKASSLAALRVILFARPPLLTSLTSLVRLCMRIAPPLISSLLPSDPRLFFSLVRSELLTLFLCYFLSRSYAFI